MNPRINARRILPAIPAILVIVMSTAVGVIGGLFSPAGTTFGFTLLGVFALIMVALGMKTTERSAKVLLFMGIGIVCVPVGAIVTGLLQ